MGIAYGVAPFISSPFYDSFNQSLTQAIPQKNFSGSPDQLKGLKSLRIGMLQDNYVGHIQMGMHQLKKMPVFHPDFSLEVATVGTVSGIEDIHAEMEKSNLDLFFIGTSTLSMAFEEIALMGLLSDMDPQQKQAWLTGYNNPTMSAISEDRGVALRYFCNMGQGFGTCTSRPVESLSDLAGLKMEWAPVNWLDPKFALSKGIQPMFLDYSRSMESMVEDGTIDMTLSRSHVENYLLRFTRFHYHRSDWMKSLDSIFYFENPKSKVVQTYGAPLADAIQGFGGLVTEKLTDLNQQALQRISEDSNCTVGSGQPMAEVMVPRLAEAQGLYVNASPRSKAIYQLKQEFQASGGLLSEMGLS